ncbi:MULTISPECIES: tyramine oxidase subunit B [unclassified Burkholderia]|uniref:tyramine oxidase subunit B n=1 Tax=unclassified Burkholderia TaxID=2613784 RepID=UPI000F5829EC|nr:MULTISPECIES: tyramine oxidase subunit B [unclassified Burkholderia]RQR32877.1 ornithine cyclodeaminase [Burkholderia sp. Bp9131]RQR64842.1 ornithine cyclodeaminase [Burkholderia sp. Bp9015]RQR74188.1 ornithine cyclodeaminase [Burkholderia sp. Bp9011]RQR86001.1 ornithine cyclodeaminase [Burkholderia sp. Bp9010]RQS66414.1 ornithine cyclodeaminase [Burkholderia sp. Bp8977]
MYPKIDFLYLSEPDMIAAGVLDAARCVSVCEETFGLLGRGDYLMGGANHNNHGMNIVFPKETKFPNMPVAGPDRRFAAMPGYLGGRFDVCGNKWYGSNHANAEKGLPRSILTMMLNDKDTGAPLALMSANLLSAARTGAVPGVAAKYLANQDARSMSVIGCGPINKACFTAIMTQLGSIQHVVCFDVFLDKANEFAGWVRQTYGITAVGTDEAEQGFRDADVITVAASRLKPLYFKDEWIKEGATILVSGPFNTDESFLTGARIVYDHTPLQEAYVEDAIASGNKESYYSSVIGGPFFRLIDAGKLPALPDSTSLGHVVNGDKPGRESTKERVIFIACGMAVFDISWGTELYNNARERKIGTPLNLWEKPAL